MTDTICHHCILYIICVFLCQSIKIKPNKYVYRQRQGAVQHTQVLKLTSEHSRRVVNCPVQPRARHWGCVFFLHNTVQ